jgi:hypothetical protein
MRGVRRETVLAAYSVCMLMVGCGSADKPAPPSPNAQPVGSATPTATAAEIPAAFRGVYEISDGCAAAARTGGMTDGAILVRSDSIDGYEDSCQLKSISASSTTAFMGVFECSSEGETDERTRSIRIAERDQVMFDDYAEPYQRCATEAPPRPQYAAVEEEVPPSASVPTPALELPKHLSCDKAAISRWEDGTMIYDLETRPATVTFPRQKYIFTGTFTQDSRTQGTLSLEGMLNVSTGQLSGGVNRTEHLEVVSVDTDGLYTVKNSAGVQYCLADAGASSNGQDSEPSIAARQQQPSAPAGMSKEDAYVASYARELSAAWMQGGACGQLLNVMTQMSQSSHPANVRVMQMDRMFDKAYDAGCIMQ